MSSSLDEFQTALVTVEKVGQIKCSYVWQVISHYPEIIHPVSKILSSLLTTQVSVERMFLKLKYILRDNRANMT